MYTDETQFELTMVVEPVDDRHPRWQEVLEAIDQADQRESIGIDQNGWLPARQVLLVAFINDEVAGHIGFAVRPAPDPSGRPAVEAELASYAVQWRFSDRPVERILFVAARRQARLIGCTGLVGFEQISHGCTGWCLAAGCA
jgi:hypothetical protein